MTDEQAIQQVVEAIRDGYDPEKIILFGSRVWGAPDADSDLDVLVIKETDEPEIDRMCEVSRLILPFQLRPYRLPIDVLVKTPHELRRRLEIGDTFMGDILMHGKVAYERASL